jgi:hypothetical protein
MKSEKFTGSAIDQLEMVYGYLFAHKGHFLLFSLVNLQIAEIRCSTCKFGVVEGSREFIEFVWLEWSIQNSES